MKRGWRWWTRYCGWVSRQAQVPVQDLRVPVQMAMVQALDTHCGADSFHLKARIRRAETLEDLWFMRADLLHAISRLHGERMAREAIAAITALFSDRMLRTARQLHTLGSR